MLPFSFNRVKILDLDKLSQSLGRTSGPFSMSEKEGIQRSSLINKDSSQGFQKIPLGRPLSLNIGSVQKPKFDSSIKTDGGEASQDGNEKPNYNDYVNASYIDSTL